jgi:hypothetical protein
MTVAVGGRGIGESCVTEIGWNAGIFARHGLKLDIVYTDGGGETQQAVVSNSAQIGVASGLLGAFSLYSKGAPVRIIGASCTGGLVRAGVLVDQATAGPRRQDRGVFQQQFRQPCRALGLAKALQGRAQTDTNRQRSCHLHRDHERTG